MKHTEKIGYVLYFILLLYILKNVKPLHILNINKYYIKYCTYTNICKLLSHICKLKNKNL